MRYKKSLAETHPEIAKQWHSNKNGELTPRDVTPGSTKKVWWKCPEGEDHEWMAPVYSRCSGRGCAVCSGKKVVVSNCIATTHPEIAKQWHPTKNGKLTPNDFVAGSNKKVWWKCNKGEDHEWESSVAGRCGGRNCPVCSGKKVVLSNCIATTHPELAKEWHPTKNGELTPYDFVSKSHKKVWWKCDKGEDHEWESKIANRSEGNGCSVCSGKKVVLSNCIATTHPELAKEWHPTKNGELTPHNVSKGMLKKVWWKCSEGEDHEWMAPVYSRSSGSGCPICAGLMVVQSNCLTATHPELAKEWHPTKNGKLTPNDFVAGSNKKVWWKCPKGEDHEWISSIGNRINGTGCSVCRGLKTVNSNSFATLQPELAKEWHPTKNGKLTPNDITEFSGKKVWWKCPKGEDHEWKTSVGNRTAGERNCPICANLIVVKSNCLATTHPELAKEWHPTKNGKLTPNDVVAGSNKKFWWLCSKDSTHEWFAKSSSRVYKDTNCPYCTLTPQSKQELIITFELRKLFKNIDPKGFKTRLDGRLRAIDIFIPKLNLCIEFDGSYWHKNKRDLDKIKSEMLLEEGFKLIRAREEPLKKIYDTDVISKQPYDGKQVTNDILSSILLMFDLDAKMVSKIKDYQSKDNLQNEKGLERYIDKILTEKAEK